MNSFKQALNLMKASWQNTLILGGTTTAFVFLAWATPYLSAFLISLGILVFQEIAQRLAIDNAWPKRLSLRIKPSSFIVVSLVLLPTSVLLGSSIGLLDNTEAFYISLPTSLGLLILAMYFYFVLSQSLRLHVEKGITIAKSIDIVGLASIRNFKFYLILSFYAAVGILIGGMTKGVGLVVTLPFIFFVNHFAYLELDQKDFNSRVPRQ